MGQLKHFPEQAVIIISSCTKIWFSVIEKFNANLKMSTPSTTGETAYGCHAMSYIWPCYVVTYTEYRAENILGSARKQHYLN